MARNCQPRLTTRSGGIYAQLVDAIAARDEEGLIPLMMGHLDHLEPDLDFSRPAVRGHSLAEQLKL